MATKEIERKIAVIFATDVVGYSKSIEINEEKTIKSLRACKKILEDLSKDIDPNVRIQVALNQKTPIKIIENPNAKINSIIYFE